jgi:hypothetical protein
VLSADETDISTVPKKLSQIFWLNFFFRRKRVIYYCLLHMIMLTTPKILRS